MSRRPGPNLFAAIPNSARFLLATLSGAVLSLSYRGEHWSVYSWFCLAILLVTVLNTKGWVAFGCGFLHGLTFVLTCVSWIAETLSVHGGMSAAAGWGVLLLIGTVWAIIIGSFAWGVERIATRSPGLALFAAPFLWVYTEVVRAYLPEISFPWSLLGYPAAGNPAIVQMTTITGIYGVSFLVVGNERVAGMGPHRSNFRRSKTKNRDFCSGSCRASARRKSGPTICPEGSRDALGTRRAAELSREYPVCR